MPEKRTKVASSAIADGVCTLTCYSDPAAGPQHVTATLVYNMSELSEGMVRDIAAYGFAALTGNRYQRSKDHPDVPAIANSLFSEMKSGDWKAGKRDSGGEGSEPTDLMKAIAEATKTPLHVVAERFETEMVKRNDGSLFVDKAGKPRKFFSSSVQRQLAADPAIAPILARLAQERASATAAAPSKLSTLFSTGGQAHPPAAEAAQ